MEGDLYENDKLDEITKRLQNYQEAIPIIKEHEAINKTKTKKTFNFTHREGCAFQKFKVSNKFMEMVKELALASQQSISRLS